MDVSRLAPLIRVKMESPGSDPHDRRHLTTLTWLLLLNIRVVNIVQDLGDGLAVVG